MDSVARENNAQIKANKTITTYDKQAIISAVQRAFDDGRLLYIDKKSGQTYDSGRKGANSPTTMSDATRKANIQRFWENVKWAKYVKNSGSKIFTSGNQSNNAMAAALEKAGISVGSKGNKQSQEKPKVKQKFSLSEPVEETRELIAVHNLTEQNLEDAYDAGTLPTVETLSENGEETGEISLIFDKENGNAPQRAVKLSEVRAAIIPDNMDNLLRRKLELSGLYTVEYPAGDEQARLEALNSLYDELAQKEKTKRERSDRELLANAEASAAVENGQERKHLREYREAFEKLKKAEQKRNAIATALETVEPDSAGAA